MRNSAFFKAAALSMAMTGEASNLHAYGPRALMTKKGKINAKIRARRNRNSRRKK